MDASKYEPVMVTISNIQVCEYVSQGRHFCHVAVFSFHVVMSCCPSHLDVIYCHVVLTLSHI